MTETNVERQKEEIEALTSIYGDDWLMISDHEYNIHITAENDQSHGINLEINFTDGYPKDGPPNYQISAPWLKGESRQKIENALNDVYLENLGESLVYLWVEKIRELVQEILETGSKSPNENVSSDEEFCFGDEDIRLAQLELTSPESIEQADDGSDWECPVITSGEVLVDRNSRFVGHIAPVFHVKQTKLMLSSLKENKKIASATHNIYACRILKDEHGGHPTFYQMCEDDGETHAGSRLLHLLQIVDARNVMVVVTRWYGGVHLGPDRFKHINNCARILLDQHGFIKSKEEKKGPKSSSGGKKKKK